jgi:hypothetical protein
MIEGQLRAAIMGRQIVELTYEDGLERTVHPHTLYRTGPGNLCIDAYQMDGASSSGGPLPSWRQFDIEKITSVKTFDVQFAVAPGYNPASPKYRHGLLAYVTQ